MGTFCGILKNPNASIPIERREEFLARLTKLFYRGGMFAFDERKLFDHTIIVLKKAEPVDGGIGFDYNYFEDDFFESAGFSRRDFCVNSGKVGMGEYSETMLAAYALEGQYTTGPFVTTRDNEWFPDPKTTGWINYLFNEKLYMKGDDPWAVYLEVKDTEDMENFSTSYLDLYKESSILVRSYYDVIAVVDGLGTLEKILSAERNDSEDNDLYNWRVGLNNMHHNLRKYVKKFKANSKLKPKRQVDELTRMLRDYFTADPLGDFLEETKASGKVGSELYEAYFLYDAPACVIKIIADIYNMDFWKVYEKVADVAKRRVFSGRILDQPFCVTTEEYFNIPSDDLVLYWTKENPIRFSQSMESWFAGLKMDYDKIISKGVDMTRPIRRIQEILVFGEEHYANIYLFDTLLNEILDNITNPEFFALWLVYERVLHDEENLSASKVLFEPSIRYQDEEDYVEKRHRRCDLWWSLGRSMKFNHGRQNVRRFIALLTNKELRKEVFGI